MVMSGCSDVQSRSSDAAASMRRLQPPEINASKAAALRLLLDLDGCSIHRARSHQKGEFFFLQMKQEFENLEERKEIIDRLPLPLPDIYKASSKTSPPPSTRNRTRSTSRVESQPDRTIGVVETPERGCPLAGQRRGSAWPGCGLGWGGVGWVGSGAPYPAAGFGRPTESTESVCHGLLLFHRASTCLGFSGQLIS